MSRRNSHGLELTFHKPSKRWRKIIKGKAYYFGTGRGIADRTSYRTALDNYHRWRADRVGPAVRPGVPRPTAGSTANGVKPDMTFEEWQQAIVDREKFLVTAAATPESFRDWQRRQTQAPDRGKTVAELVDDFKRDCQRRRKLTVELGDKLPKKQRMGESRLGGIGYEIRPFVESYGKTVLPFTPNAERDEMEIAAILTKYRKQQEDLMLAGKIASSYFSDRIRTIRQFIRWAVRNFKIRSLPRNGELFQTFEPTEKKQNLSSETIRRLWKAADARLRCFMALALNCAFYSIDISDLTPANIKGGYCAGKRGKTGVPFKFKLWKITQELIAQCRDDGNPLGRLFVTRFGCLLVHGTTSAIKIAFRRLVMGVRLTKKNKKGKTVPAVSFSNLRDSTATRVEQIDPNLTESLLAHASAFGGMKRHYVDLEPEQLNRAELDKALEQVLADYRLTN